MLLQVDSYYWRFDTGMLELLHEIVGFSARRRFVWPVSLYTSESYHDVPVPVIMIISSSGGDDLSLMEPITCHMEPISEQVEIHLPLSRRASDGRSRPGSRERKLLALPTLDMYLPPSKFESASVHGTTL